MQLICSALEVAPGGYYDWLLQPVSNHAQEDARLLHLIRASFVANHGIYGAPRVFLDLREAGETCSKNRVARLMRQANLRALHGYRIRRWAAGKPSVLIPHLLKRQFTITKPNAARVTDITYIRTWQGWLYLAVVTDLFSRRIVGWAAQPTIRRELVLDAVLVAVRQRRPPGHARHRTSRTLGTSATAEGAREYRRSFLGHRNIPLPRGHLTVRPAVKTITRGASHQQAAVKPPAWPDTDHTLARPQMRLQHPAAPR